MKTKQCTKCHLERGLSEFGSRAASKNGKESMCRYCINKLQVEKYTQRFKYVRMIDFPCKFGDFRKTNLWLTQLFVSGDGGYQEYINERIINNS